MGAWSYFAHGRKLNLPQTGCWKHFSLVDHPHPASYAHPRLDDLVVKCEQTQPWLTWNYSSYPSLFLGEMSLRNKHIQ